MIRTRTATAPASGAQHRAAKAPERCGCGGQAQPCKACAAPSGEAAAVIRATQASRGRALDETTRTTMEQQFKRDFSRVRVHADDHAADVARAVHANAFTYGANIFFGAARYRPQTARGRALLAHELTHVVQQAGAAARDEPVMEAPGSAHEREARRMAAGLPTAITPAPRRLARQLAGATDEIATAPAPSSEPIVLMTIDLATKKVALHGRSGRLYEGTVNTNLGPGLYHLIPLMARHRWNIVGVKGGLRFDIELNGPDPFQLKYERRVQLQVLPSAAASADVELPLSMRIGQINRLLQETYLGATDEERVIGLIESLPLEQAAEAVKLFNERRFEGRTTFDELDRRITFGNNLRLHEALSKLRMKAMGVEKGAAALATAPILPWHDVMGIFEDSATFSAEATPGGKIRIKYLGGTRLFHAKDFGTEIKHLPFNLLVGGQDYEPDQVLIIHDYDQGRFVPVVAQQLAGYQHAGIRKFLSDVATVASFAIPVSAAESALARAAIFTFERILPAAMLLIDENRLNIVAWWPNWGPKMLRYADLIKVGVAAYGIVRFAVSGWQIFQGLKSVRGARGALEGASADAKMEALAVQLENEADGLIGEAQKIHDSELAAAKPAGGAGARPAPEPAPPAVHASDPAPPRPRPQADAKGAAASERTQVHAPETPGVSQPAAGQRPGAASVNSVNPETKAMLARNPALKEALEANPRAADLLKLCKSLCYPEFATPDQAIQLERALARAESLGLSIDREALRAQLHRAKDVRQLQRMLGDIEREVDRTYTLGRGIRQDLIDAQRKASARGAAAMDEDGLTVLERGRRTQRLAESEPREVLRGQLGKPPAEGMHAHHIVPEAEGGARMNWLRQALRRAGIDINARENGVYLVGMETVANPEGTIPHTTYLHAGNRDDYLYTLTRRLANKEGPTLRAELAKIKRELSEGDFMFRTAPDDWRPGVPGYEAITPPPARTP
ncbi:DUF4157 domain-containing protein [Caballeronia sp. SEWSISQ10-4 2]|uniref:eCIS core domain-containing protein n=1 Tax=Caballeronia sp. SEWSISQ10-4 2 TaxID=2937438 RepID=UPI00264DA9E7|nr:DUF4157 domain-containing protein [Caballeronia sp. SEWSISQ10-4 2]MDN7179625.1 DUF4157 domain-containing protein [Caballeronia sp. SEWSISQ10-4 2]